VERLGSLRSPYVPCRSAARLAREPPRFAVVLPVFDRLYVRRTDNELVDCCRGGFARHHFTSTILRLSIPRSSITFTATRLWGPGSKGNEVVPRYASI